jgi:hypothetical protein
VNNRLNVVLIEDLLQARGVGDVSFDKGNVASGEFLYPQQ